MPQGFALWAGTMVLLAALNLAANYFWGRTVFGRAAMKAFWGRLLTFIVSMGAGGAILFFWLAQKA